MLVGAMRGVFAASDVLTPLVVPLLLEKLSSSVVDAKRDAIQTLEHCLPTYAGPSLSPLLADISGALEREALHPHDRGAGNGSATESLWTATTTRSVGASAGAIGLNFSGEGRLHDASGVGLYAPRLRGSQEDAAALAELPLVEVALHGVAALARVLSLRAVQGHAGAAQDWDVGIGRLVRTAIGEVRRAADSLVGRGSARILCAIASASHHALSHVLAATVPVALDRLAEAHEHHRWGVRSALVVLLAGLVHAVDPALDYAPGKHPLAPFIPDLLPRLAFELLETAPALDHDHASKGPVDAPPVPPDVAVRGSVARCTAAAALCDLVVRPPSLLLSAEETSSLAHRLAKLLMAETDRRVCDAVLRALCTMGK